MMASQTDLFALPPLGGLAYGEACVNEAEERDLIAAIEAEPLSQFRFQNWLGKRLTRSFGWSYDFETGRFDRAEPIPDWLSPLRGRAAAFAGIAAEDLVQALLIRYDPGVGIGWHRDRPVFEHVVGISLGAPATMRLRRRTGAGFARNKVWLKPRSIYHLWGEARHEWEHSIASMDARRWSITFRSLRDGERR